MKRPGISSGPAESSAGRKRNSFGKFDNISGRIANGMFGGIADLCIS